MSEKTAHLLQEFDSLPAGEKELFTLAILSQAQAALRSAKSLSKSARVSALREWVGSHPLSPPLSGEAISRETIYADRG